VWCLERLQWGLGSCESVRQADCVETLNCHGDPLVQECRFTRVGGAQRCSPADLGDKLVIIIIIINMQHLTRRVSVNAQQDESQPWGSRNSL